MMKGFTPAPALARDRRAAGPGMISVHAGMRGAPVCRRIGMGRPMGARIDPGAGLDAGVQSDGNHGLKAVGTRKGGA